MEHMDKESLAKTLDGMTLEQRREWIIKILMAKTRKSFRDIAKRHRISIWGLSGAVNGTFPWYKGVVNAIEKELDIDVTFLLSPRELQKNGRDKHSL